MRNVVRGQEPKLFRSKADGWRKALLGRVATGEKVSSYYYDRYNQPNTKTIRKELENNLLKMYEGMCCYCEEATPRMQGEIEHLKPKKRFPINAYEWKNLHWVCRVCNRRKLEKYDEAKPILDPSDAESISNHIELEIEEDIGWVWLINKDNSARGDTTINHADLNRGNNLGS